MKYILNLVKKLCLGIFAIYSINVFFKSLSFYIPINIYTISLSSFLGIFGIIAFIIVKLTI